MTQRIATRLFSILTLGMLTFALASACASEQSTDPFLGKDASIQGTGGGGASGSCDPTFCPGGTMGGACCITPNGPCGMNFGMGCVQTTANPPDGG